MLANQGELYIPETATLPRSAKLTDARDLAAQPVLELKSVNRNSLTHISADFESPSSSMVCSFLRGFRIPIMMLLTSLIAGLPRIVTIFLPSKAR